MVKQTLTACILQTLDGIGHDTDAAKETTTLLLVNLSVVPDTDGNCIHFPYIPARKKEETLNSNHCQLFFYQQVANLQVEMLVPLGIQ